MVLSLTRGQGAGYSVQAEVCSQGRGHHQIKITKAEDSVWCTRGQALAARPLPMEQT